MFPVVTALWVVADGTEKLLGMRLQEAADSSETVVTNYKALLCGIPEYNSLNRSLKPQMLPSAGYSTTTHQRRKKVELLACDLVWFGE